LLSNDKKDVDGRDKPGHDGKWNQFQTVSRTAKILAAFSAYSEDEAETQTQHR
jgi:hypothetical protein